MSISTLDSRFNNAGKPSAMATIGATINKRQERLLSSLTKEGAKTAVSKSTVSMKDLAALTAKEQVEFSMLTNGNIRLIVRGNERQVLFSEDDLKQFVSEGWKLSGHTHATYDKLGLIASDADYEMLKKLGQTRSVVYNSNGQFLTFEN